MGIALWVSVPERAVLRQRRTSAVSFWVAVLELHLVRRPRAGR